MQIPAEKTHVHTDYAGYTPCHLLRLSSYSFFFFSNHPFSPLLDSSPLPPLLPLLPQQLRRLCTYRRACMHVVVLLRTWLSKQGEFFSLTLFSSLFGSLSHGLDLPTILLLTSATIVSLPATRQVAPQSTPPVPKQGPRKVEAAMG